MVDKSKTCKKNQSSCSSSGTSSSSNSASDPDYGLRRSIKIQKQNRPKRKNVQGLYEEVSEINDQFRRRTESCSTSRKKRKLKKDNKSSISNEEYENFRISSIRKRSTTKKTLDNKNTKRTIFSWLIDTRTIQEGAEVFSVDEMSKQMKKNGIIKRNGIFCLCCNKIFTATNFHVHCGRNCDKPYESIILSRTRVSILNYMIEAWNKVDESTCHKSNIIEAKSNVSDLYDDACMICADGGNLLCCEGCYSTYHRVCLGMKDVPEESWYCPYCACKFCANPVYKNDYLLTCPQCEKRYHWECHEKKNGGKIDINSIPLAPFCKRSCQEVTHKLAKEMVGKRNELDEGYSWTLLHRVDDDGFGGMYIEDNYLRTICHCKLAVARRLMEECFEPIQDRHTRIQVLPSVVYNCGANFNRINFKGFYTAVLEKDDEIISVATLRIHGTKLAEMPFIATCEEYRCKGMCKKLMIAIESALCYLNVENLIIPSVPERIGNWIERYGFCRLKASMEQEIMAHNTLMFHDSVRLQKTLLPSITFTSHTDTPH